MSEWGRRKYRMAKATYNGCWINYSIISYIRQMALEVLISLSVVCPNPELTRRVDWDAQLFLGQSRNKTTPPTHRCSFCD